MLKIWEKILYQECDAPRPWGLYFQDSAAPQMEGLIELHDNIMFYLIIILFGVGWILASVITNYSSEKSPISHKYLNHGTNVPTRKCTKFKYIPLNYKVYTGIRTYSTLPNENNDNVSSKVYEDIYSMKNTILKENIGKSGI